ncbi:hypothetical protein Forpe1208_v012438 [Fusarium oxysporum f. sp. rapae]|uniref:Uncharacterized protein n=1 Tax=Fusarium oxysporum f. sp. rapae TaxID=485398 RepID=A0A8J5NN87_FUSOX|nr:hypothetical protein Forpe1208_v012438 [Fusarium oxysporum f. sp. rapae]
MYSLLQVSLRRIGRFQFLRNSFIPSPDVQNIFLPIKWQQLRCVKFTGGEPILNMAIITRGHSAKLLSNSPRASFPRSTRTARPSPQPHNIKRNSQATRDLRKQAVRLARKETKD